MLLKLLLDDMLMPIEPPVKDKPIKTIKPKPIKRTYEENMALVKARAEKSGIKKIESDLVIDIESDFKPEPIQLVFPGWSMIIRGVPNFIVRSALFGAIQRGVRAYRDNVKIASFNNVTLTYSGFQLDQSDLDVWLHCLHLVRDQKNGMCILFTENQFLKDIDRSTGSPMHVWLTSSLTRLTKAILEINDGRVIYSGAMISHYARDIKSGKFVLELNPMTVQLFGKDMWSSINYEQRKSLRSRPLAQWLHGFYTTHAKPHPLLMETLHRLCASENDSKDGFQQKLKTALARLAEATGWQCKIEADKVHVTKTVAKSCVVEDSELCSRG